MGIALDHHFLSQAHAARFAHPADIIAAQINQHEVLGDLFLIGQQLRLKRLILLFGRTAPTGTGDRSNGHQSLLESHQNFGG